MIRLEYGQLLTQSRFVLALRIDTTTDRRHMLAKLQVEAFHETGIDLPTALGQYLIDVTRVPNTARCFTPVMRRRR